MKKLLCALLAGLMALSIVSCGNAGENQDETAAGTKADVTEEESREKLDIPETKYNNVELTFLTRDAGEWTTLDIFAEDGFSDNISEAVYTRNEIVRDRYGILIREIKTTTTASDVSKEVAASSGDFQGIVSMLSDACSFVSQGYLHDLNNERCSYMDFTKSWWDGKLAKDLAIEDHIYFATGDLLTADNDGTFAIMFNKKLAENAQLPNLYDLVANKGWTMDRMYEYEQQVIIDNDGDGKLAYDSDIAGFAYTGDTPYSMLYAGGVTIMSRDEDGALVYALDVERASNVADKVQKILSKDLSIDMNAVGGSVVEVGQKTFGESHCLFFGECLQCVTRMRGYDVDFGILPYPKYDDQQPTYCSVMEWVGGVVSIPRSVDADLDMVTSMIEAMAYHAVPTLTHQYYEINLKTRDAKDEQSGPMIDLILAYRIYDPAYAFQWNGVVGNLAATMLPGAKGNVASRSKSFQKLVEKAANDVIKKIEKFEK